MPYEKRKKDGKVCVYKEGSDKPLGCHDTEADADDQIAALHANVDMSTLDTEIFAVGKWNGMNFSLADLDGMVAAFNALRDNHKVSLKLGHNDEQALTDGKPALGWVDRVWVSGNKLMARFTDMPKIVVDAIKKKLYKHVSVELDLDVQYKATRYPFVLSGVALLGADIPAVNTLKDLTHYMSRGAAFSVGRRAVFSAIAGNTQSGGIKMEQIEILTRQVADLTGKVANFTTEKATLAAENADLKAKVAKFEADMKARAEADAKAAVAAKRTVVLSILEDGVKREVITPVQRTQYSALLRIDNDDAVMAIDVETVKALVPAGGKQFSREHARQNGGGDQGAGDDPVRQVTAECMAMVGKGEAKDFMAAQVILFTRNPKLAREYVDFNNKE